MGGLLPQPRASASYGYAAAPPPRRTLPVLVGILAILIALVGIVVTILGLLVLLYGLGVVGHGYDLLHGIPVSFLVIFGAIYFIFGVVMIAVARGLWDLESWALWTTGVVVFIELVNSVLNDEIVLALIFVLLFVYLLAVRHHFD